jgi:hypothetical protein
MRKSGLCLALLASAPLVLCSNVAFADGDQPAAPAPAPAASSSDAAPAAAAPAPAAAPAAASGTVPIHINSDTTVTLQHRSGEGGAWETLCQSPCDAAGPTGDQYQITGDNLNESRPFTIDGSKGKVTLDVQAGSKQKQKVGMGFLIGGGVLTLTGLIWAIAESAGPLHADTNSPGFVSGTGAMDGGTTHNDHWTGVFMAGAFMFVGIGAGLYGAGTMLANNHSDVQGDVQKAQPTRGQNDAPAREAQVRLPTPTLMVPVLHGSF